TVRNTGLATTVSGSATFNIGIRTEADGGQQAYGISRRGAERRFEPGGVLPGRHRSDGGHPQPLRPTAEAGHSGSRRRGADPERPPATELRLPARREPRP